jgi:hypothetical protein
LKIEPQIIPKMAKLGISIVVRQKKPGIFVSLRLKNVRPRTLLPNLTYTKQEAKAK